MKRILITVLFCSILDTSGSEGRSLVRPTEHTRGLYDTAEACCQQDSCFWKAGAVPAGIFATIGCLVTLGFTDIARSEECCCSTRGQCAECINILYTGAPSGHIKDQPSSSCLTAPSLICPVTHRQLNIAEEYQEESRLQGCLCAAPIPFLVSCEIATCPLRLFLGNCAGYKAVPVETPEDVLCALTSQEASKDESCLSPVMMLWECLGYPCREVAGCVPPVKNSKT
jgi:hypothetical protein